MCFLRLRCSRENFRRCEIYLIAWTPICRYFGTNLGPLNHLDKRRLTLAIRRSKNTLRLHSLEESLDTRETSVNHTPDIVQRIHAEHT